MINYKNKKHNWLLMLSIFCFVLFTIFYFVYGISGNNSRSKNFVQFNFLLLAISSTLVAPICEEIVFRGFFSNKKYLKITSLLLSIVIVFYIFLENFGVIVGCLFLLVVISLVTVYHKKLKYPFLILTANLSALVFSLIHWKSEDFAYFSTAYLLLSQLGLAYLLTWITVNWNLLRSILFHCAYNTSLFFVGTFELFIVDETKNQIINEKNHINWNKVSILSRTSSLFNSDSTYEFVSADLLEINKIYLNKKLDNYKLVNNPFQKYNISFETQDKIKSKDSLQAAFIEALLEAKLIKSNM